MVDDTAIEITESQQEEARQYHITQLVCDLVDRGIDIIFLSIAALVAAVPLDLWLEQSLNLQHPVVRLIVFYLVLTLAHFLVSLGVSYYSGFVVEHRYGMSHQSLRRWFAQYLKRVGLTLALGLFLTLGLYAIIWTVGRWWWIVTAAAFFLLSVVIGQLFPVLILPLFQKSERLERSPLTDRFDDLAKGTGLTIEGVYRLHVSDDTAKANAQLAGIGATRRVLLDDTLLEQFSEDELAVVFAHEVGHHVHRHIPKLVAMGAIYSTGAFLLCDIVLSHWVTRIDGHLDYDTFPVYALPMFNLVFLAASLAIEPVQNLVSRLFERQADRYALRATGLHAAFRSAFLKLAKLNKATLDPPRWEVVLFHSHPPISERIRSAQVS